MRFKIDFLEDYGRDSLTAELRRIAGLTGKRSVSKADIDRLGRMNSRTVRMKVGTLRRANEAAGLEPGRFTKATDDELLRILISIWSKTQAEKGRSPRGTDLRAYGHPIAPSTISTRFGSWKKALIAAAAFAERDAKEPAAAEPDPPAPRPRPLSARKRYMVLRRDRFTCRACGSRGGELEVDHVVPVKHGGSDRLDNLQTLCGDCNRGKGSDLETRP